VSADPRRRAALAALLAVQRGRGLDQQLARLRRALDQDRAAAAAGEELVRGALQWQARYDHLVARFSTRKPTTDPVVRGVLHLALHQLLTSRGVPAYAAVHQAGELLRAEQRSRAVGYANAVLQGVQRHVAAAGATSPLAALEPLFADLERSGGVAARLSAWWSHPAWLVERWVARFGTDATARLLAHANTPPPVTLHVLPGRHREAAARELAAAGAAARPLAGFPRALQLQERCDRARLRELLAAVPGLLVQDAAAQDVVDWLVAGGRDLDAVAGSVLDLCAAPGGKAVHLRALLPAARAVVAMDRDRRRLVRLRENRDRLAPAGLPLVIGDGAAPPLRPASCAAVLVDGPCSGTGVGRHHPEGRWRLRPGTLRRNADRLLALAAAAAELLVPGGRLYYATCSLEPEENEEVVARLLAACPGLAPAPDPDGEHRRHWWPWERQTDGFFAARLQRREGAVRPGTAAAVHGGTCANEG